MILIEPTKYTKKITGRSWKKNLYSSSEVVFLFFMRMTRNQLCRVRLGDDYYQKWNHSEKRFTYGGRFYATDKNLIIGIGANKEEAIESGKLNEGKFKNYSRIIPTHENIDFAITSSKSYFP